MDVTLRGSWELVFLGPSLGVTQAMKHPTRVCWFCLCRNGIYAICLQINNIILKAYPIHINNFLFQKKKKKSLQGLAVQWCTWVGRVILVNSISNTKLFNKPGKALKSLLFISILLWGRSQSKLKHHIAFLVFLQYWRTMCVILLYKTRLKGKLQISKKSELDQKSQTFWYCYSKGRISHNWTFYRASWKCKRKC